MGFRTFLKETFNPKVIDRYTAGYCDCLAVALHQLTGLPLGALIESTPDLLIHVFVFVNDREILDIKGRRTISDFLKDRDFTGYLNPTIQKIDIDWLALHGYSKSSYLVQQAMPYAKQLVERYL